jgi:V-type H+-transporting ATPase subunit G
MFVRRFTPSSYLIVPDRTKRVKDARAEAQKEIDEYKEQKEGEFKDFESEVCTP